MLRFFQRFVAVLALMVSSSLPAWGDTGDGDQATPLLPPDPELTDPVLSGSLFLTFFAPVDSGGVCPPPADCVFAGGGGIGAQLDRRWPEGAAVGLGYELGFVDTEGVYQLGLMQELQVQAKYYFFPRIQLHPFVGAAVGAIIFGDTFRVATAGASLTAVAGIEFELTELLSIRLSVPFRAFRLAAFTTARDRVRRGTDETFGMSLGIQVGLTITEFPE